MRNLANFIKPVIVVLALAAVYFVASKIGFLMAFEAEQVTVVWPPTGIALAAVLFFGYRAWPGIALGAFLTNVTAHEPTLTALGIAIGNTLEVVIGAYLCRRVGFDNSLARVKDVLSLVIFSAIFSTMVSATIGVTSLCLGHVQLWTAYHSLWMIWWLGDATGALIFAPVLLIWSNRRSYDSFRQYNMWEAFALALGMIITSLGIFTEPLSMGIIGHVFIYLIFPFTIWAALRFGQHGTTSVTLAASIIAIWATMHGSGPFTTVSLDQSLNFLQIFMAVVAVTGLLLGSAITERKWAEKALKEADRRKDEFIATLSHELRNPLAPLSNALSILQSSNSGTKHYSDSLEIMGRQVKQITRLVDDLLDISRISHGKLELKKNHITLEEVINNALETAKPLIEEKGHQLSVHLPTEPIWLSADLTRLSQVFSNLLNNAIKYTPADGWILIEAKADEKTITVSMRDTGIGIPENMLTRIFNIFTQVDSSIERAHGGLGIGLMLVKNLVEMHGGSIEAHSEGKDKGSEFLVKLPIVAAPAVQPIHDSSPSTSVPEPEMFVPETPSLNLRERKLRVLVVEDNKELAQTLGWMIELLGYEVKILCKAEEALDVAKSFLPDVIMLDIGLSGVSGYELCRKMREEPSLKHRIFIAHTGWGQQEHRKRSSEAGFDHHLVKPVSIETLGQLLKSLPENKA